MARRRRGGMIKASRQNRRSRRLEKASDVVQEPLEDGNGGSDPRNCIGEARNGEPVVHHKKFGKIRVREPKESSPDTTEMGTVDVVKEELPNDSKSSDDVSVTETSDTLENDHFAIDLMRGIVNISGSEIRNHYDFRNQSSVYKAENDIPLDGSVIIKPGTFSSNTISSNVRGTSFFTAVTDVSSVNLFNVLQGIEMLERKVSCPQEFRHETEKQEVVYFMDSTPVCGPILDDAEMIKKNRGENSKMDADEDSQTMSKCEEEQKIVKSVEVSSLEDTTSSDLQNETDDAMKKMEDITLLESRETSSSPILKASDEVVEKKFPTFRSRTGSTDTTGSEGSSTSGAAIRRSNRIKSIGMLKQKEREQAVIKPDLGLLRSPLPLGSPLESLGTLSVSSYDDKPVKVKSRWRRSSELEMHGGKSALESSDGGNSSPGTSVLDTVPTLTETPERELERLKKERRDVEDGLKTFTILTENEYKMERSACKETKRMICDCVLTKEEIERDEVGCGEDCLNRMLFLECGPRCALGERCTNKRFQKLEYANCKIFKTQKKGFGLRAEEDLSGNTFIMEYVGEVVDQKEFGRRVKMYAKDKNKHFYFMALKGDAVIDATNKGNISRFINHSCDPNAETQKWTINGELRVGFFTRRFVPAGEEITFDYQFQRYGKEAQKCYCEAATCRGWIGENPENEEGEDGGVGHNDEDEDDDDDEYDDHDDDEEDEEEDKEEEKRMNDEESYEQQNTLNVTSKEGDDVNDNNESALKTNILAKERKSKTWRKKRLEKERKAIVDDMGLDEEIQKLFKTGLKNRAHTLTLSRLMIRAEDWSTRSKLLKLIREGETPCRRLFLDYHGLRLICGWMLSRELEESQDRDERRIEILKTLAKLPIPNKNMLTDSKIFVVVDQWAKSEFLVEKKSCADEESGIEDTKKIKLEEIIPGLGGEIDNSLPEGNGIASSSENNDIFIESGRNVRSMAENLLETWTLLKEVFKIPKKERIEQMKEHERQADRGYSEYLDNKENLRQDRYARSDRYRERERDRVRERDRKRTRESPPDPDWLRNHERVSKLSKQERRKLFALKVLQEDEEAKKRNEHLELWKLHESRCLALGLDPNLNAVREPDTGFPMFFDQNSGGWQSGPPSSGPSPLPHAVPPSPMYPIGPALCSGIALCPNMNGSLCGGAMCHEGVLRSSHTSMCNGSVNSSGSLPPSRENMKPAYLGLAPLLHHCTTAQFPLSLPQTLLDPDLPVFEDQVHPETIPLPFEEDPSPMLEPPPTDPVISEIALNVPNKLPPKWKGAKDLQGRIYFYHVKERVSQWEEPHWTEEDLRKEAARSLDSEVDEDSCTSTDSSSDTSSEEEFDEDEEVDDGNEVLTNINDYVQLEIPMMKTSFTDPDPDIMDIDVMRDTDKDMGKDIIQDEKAHSPVEISNGIRSFEDEKDDDLSAWEDEEEITETKVTNQPALQSPMSLPALTAQPSKSRRIGLVQEIIISPRREEDKVDNRKYKEVKEMLRKQKDGSRIVERRKDKLQSRDKMTLRSMRSKRKRREKSNRRNRVKTVKVTTSAADIFTDKRIKENFKNNIAGAIVSHLNPYRKQDCKVGRITCNEDFKHLARKLTHFVMLKELKHCRGVDDLECNDSVKAKARDFIRKYMAKFGAVYQRPENDTWKA